MGYRTDTSLSPREQVRRALRSGEFTQGRNMLQGADESLCCLGVACLVAEQNGIPVLRCRDGRLQGLALTNDQPHVLVWLGLTEAEESQRVDWNDLKRRSFRWIARHF